MSQTLSFTVQAVHEGEIHLDHLELIIGADGHTSEVFMNGMALTNVSAATVHIKSNQVTTVTLELLADEPRQNIGNVTAFPPQEVQP